MIYRKLRKKNYKKEKKKKKGKTRKKEHSTELQKPNIEAQVYNNNKKCDCIYTYMYQPIIKIKAVQQK